MMLAAALRPPLQSLAEGPSTVFWVAVVEWTVVIRASSIPKASCTTCAYKLEIGARGRERGMGQGRGGKGREGYDGGGGRGRDEARQGKRALKGDR